MKLNTEKNQINSEIVALEWSHSQQCFHNQSLYECLKEGVTGFALNRANDYVLVGIFNSYDEAHAYSEKMRLLKNKPALSRMTFNELIKMIGK